MKKRLPFLIFCLLLLSACHSTQTIDNSAAVAATRVAKKMIGQPYQYGGKSPGGFDCSGLVWYSYHRVGINTARTSKELRRQARRVSRRNLRAGDLVFFKGWFRTGHVGIYLGDGLFIHAPSSGKRVKTDRMDSGYWYDHFKSAGRIVD